MAVEGIIDARKAAVVEAIRRGLPRVMAADLAGINRVTVWTWANPDHDAFDQSFANALHNAESEYAQSLLRNVELAGNIHNEKTGQLDWRAHAWLLERRFPAHFKEQREVGMVGPGGGPVQVQSMEVQVRLKATLEVLKEIGALDMLEIETVESNGNGANGQHE